MCESEPAVKTLAGLELPAVKLASENTSDWSVTASSASTSSERRALPAFVLVEVLGGHVALLRCDCVGVGREGGGAGRRPGPAPWGSDQVRRSVADGRPVEVDGRRQPW